MYILICMLLHLTKYLHAAEPLFLSVLTTLSNTQII